MANPTTDLFKAVIKKYLDARAEKDPLFKPMYAKPNKSLEECWKYIVSEARKQAVNQCACISDEDVYNMAVHYYMEDDVKAPTTTPKVKVATTEPKKTIPLNPVQTSNQKKPSKTANNDKPIQLSLFDF
jgi:hypothetical protein